jgi:metal-responsive CopG/Arc/MetJ family transcriptional regulator
MLEELSNRKIVMGICLPKSLKETIDYKRGDIPRSKYISRILKRQLDHENSEVNQQNV